MAASREPGHVGNVADDQPGDDRAYAEQAGHGGAAGGDRRGQFLDPGAGLMLCRSSAGSITERAA